MVPFWMSSAPARVRVIANRCSARNMGLLDQDGAFNVKCDQAGLRKMANRASFRTGFMLYPVAAQGAVVWVRQDRRPSSQDLPMNQLKNCGT